MTDTDFNTISFINSNMRFCTFTDFYNKRTIIKYLYRSLNPNGKVFYKWYVYANIHMRLNYKNKIWDYINGFTTDSDLNWYVENYHVINI